ncbi:MAG TPA: hypothetical protein VJ788_05185 [Gemmatimonadota bacterium]|nr:hypothetical protein [Gemmatimonadota bacterium]
MSTRELRATLPIVLLALLVGGTCGGQSTPTPPDRRSGGSLSGSVVRDGIEYRADVLVMESFPVQLSGRATVRNTSGTARTVSFPDGCVALLRAYRTSGGGPVWDQAEELACTMAIVPVDLAPGEEREIPTPSASAYEILGTELPDGEYRIAVYLRPIEAGEVEIAAGTTDLAIPR